MQLSLSSCFMVKVKIYWKKTLSWSLPHSISQMVIIYGFLCVKHVSYTGGTLSFTLERHKQSTPDFSMMVIFRQASTGGSMSSKSQKDQGGPE